MAFKSLFSRRWRTTPDDGVTSVCLLRDHSWQGLGDHLGCQELRRVSSIPGKHSTCMQYLWPGLIRIFPLAFQFPFPPHLHSSTPLYSQNGIFNGLHDQLEGEITLGKGDLWGGEGSKWETSTLFLTESIGGEVREGRKSSGRARDTGGIQWVGIKASGPWVVETSFWDSRSPLDRKMNLAIFSLDTSHSAQPSLFWGGRNMWEEGGEC